MGDDVIPRVFSDVHSHRTIGSGGREGELSWITTKISRRWRRGRGGDTNVIDRRERREEESGMMGCSHEVASVVGANETAFDDSRSVANPERL